MNLKRLVLVALLVTALATTPAAWAAGPFYTGVDVATSQDETRGFFATLVSFWQTIWNAARGEQYPISGASDEPMDDPTSNGRGGGMTPRGDEGPGLDPLGGSSSNP